MSNKHKRAFHQTQLFEAEALETGLLDVARVLNRVLAKSRYVPTTHQALALQRLSTSLVQARVHVADAFSFHACKKLAYTAADATLGGDDDDQLDDDDWPTVAIDLGEDGEETQPHGKYMIPVPDSQPNE